MCYHAYHTCSKSEWFPAIQLTHFMPTFYWFISRASFWICLTTGSTELNRTKLKWQVILTHCLILCESSSRSTWFSTKVQVVKVILNIFWLDCFKFWWILAFGIDVVCHFDMEISIHAFTISRHGSFEIEHEIYFAFERMFCKNLSILWNVSKLACGRIGILDMLKHDQISCL